MGDIGLPEKRGFRLASPLTLPPTLQWGDDLRVGDYRWKESITTGSAAAIRRPLNRLLADRVSSPCQNPSKTFMLRSRKVEAIKVHHLVPGRYEVMDKLLLRIRTSVDFSEGAELGV